ncbi:RluA family pseudouridine synthase [Teretinema zuelzerae]|nr:RluA family pseudouridine synthase [Teretinema zuelzerae]
MPRNKYTVDSSAGSGMRLDKYCATLEGAPSRSRLKNGALQIVVNDAPAKMSRQVRAGDVIIIEWEDPLPETPEPENIPLDILYEDENVTVVNKKQGMVTHPAAGNWTGTLVHALLWHWGGRCSCGGMRPGIVHRLDKDTSGVLITAKNRESETWLQDQFSGRKVKKIYAAILSGVPKKKDGEIKTHLFRDPRNRKRFTWSEESGRGKASWTSYQVVAVYGSYSLVLFTLHTGRTHQLRVHSKFLGCPILGDPVYGKKDPLFPSATLMLHARSLTIALPFSSEIKTFIAPFPRRFAKVIRKLRDTYDRRKEL